MGKLLPAVLGGLLLLVACADRPEKGSGETSVIVDSGLCHDSDGDGYGRGCQPGPDCDDSDPMEFSGCTDCPEPAGGCACAAETALEPCYLDMDRKADGELMCHEGTRQCRAGVWSVCEDIFSYPLPDERKVAALIDSDAGPVTCNACNPACFRITDNLDPVDGGLSSSNNSQVDWSSGGGLTLEQDLDATITAPVDGGYDPSTCVIGVTPDLDCDGIPDDFDPYPMDPPFATANPAIFLDVAAGETGTGVIDLAFFLNSADVYFLVDQSGSMDDERDRLKSDLVSGDFINDASYDCADYDYDRVPNNELKDDGIIGAIKCIIRDSNFGVGFFREIPFSGYANSDQVVFGNHQDVTNVVTDVQTGVGQLTTIGNLEWPEAAMPALHNLVTGDGMYFGTTKPGIPPRLDCPAGRWGYPCFRDGAIPIVMLFTDAQMHNGPSSNDYAYNSSNLGITAGTGSAYVPVDTSNETYGTAYDAGDLTDIVVTHTGSTASMSADIPRSELTCAGEDSSPDAFYKFSLSQRRTVTLSSEGSRFDTVLGLYAGIPATPTVLPDSNDLNENAASAQNLGAVTGMSVQIDGDTRGMNADYLGSALGCDAAATSPDAVYAITVSSDTSVEISTASSALDTVIALYDQAPTLAPTYPDHADNTNNDALSRTDLGEVYNGVVAMAGDTSAAGLSASYLGSELGCGVADGANDVVYSFDLASPTRVQVSSEGSDFDTVLALVGDTCVDPMTGCNSIGVSSLVVPASAESLSSSYALGDANGRIFELTGDSTAMSADHSAAEVGCGADSTAPDTVVSFELNSAADIEILTDGTGFDHVVALYPEAAGGGTTIAASNDKETTDDPQVLGSINGKIISVTGGNTTGMVSDYTGSHMTCAPGTAGSGDAVYQFTLDSETTIRLDTLGASFDTAISLHDGSIGAGVAAIASTAPTMAESPAMPHTLASSITGSAHIVSGSTSSMRGDVTLNDWSGTQCHRWSDDGGRDAVIEFDVAVGGTYDFDLSSTFRGALGLYPKVAEPIGVPQIDTGTAGSSAAAGVQLSRMDDWWARRSGRTTSNFWTSNQCGARRNARDVMVEFSLDASHDLTFSTAGSDINSVVMVYKWDDAGHTSSTSVACDGNGATECGWTRRGYSCWSGDDGEMSVSLSSGDYFVIVTGEGNRESGDYELSIRDNTLNSNNLIECSGNSFDPSISRYLNSGTYYAVVKGYEGGDSGSFDLQLKDNSITVGAGVTNLVDCNDEGAGAGTASVIERTLPAGDYYVVVSGSGGADEGSYTLTLQDVDNPPVDSSIACGNSLADGNAQLLMNSLPAGRYWAVLKGMAPGEQGAYGLTIREQGASAGQVLACDDNSAGGASALIEEDLPAGRYYVVVKGKGVSDDGNYKVAVRDVSNQQVTPLACDRDGGSGETSVIRATLSAGSTYYVVVKGDIDGDADNYRLTIADQANTTLGAVTCDDDSGAYRTSVISRTLDPGEYYVALKGYYGSNMGDYQLTLGGGSTSWDRYVPPTWSDTAAALQSRGVRVIPILSCHDDPDHGDGADCDNARAQAQALANATDTLGPSLDPLVYDIDRDGAGLSKNVIEGITSLANYLEMDIKVALSFDPDPNPGFIVTVQALDEPGDGCTGLSGGIEHTGCIPGATPRFNVTFNNPSGAPVPLNPDDPNGGYNFRAQLIGDGTYLVDQIPIYIIPESVTPDPDTPVYYSSGEYWQDMDSPGCSGNQRPDWRDLGWNAEVPAGTEIQFSACAEESAENLDGCAANPIAKISGSGSCLTDAECALGFCDSAVGACQIVTGGSCAGDSDCPTNASCEVGLCTFSSQPIYVGQYLNTGNFQPYLRVSIALGGTPPVTDPPVLHSWDMTYQCGAAF